MVYLSDGFKQHSLSLLHHPSFVYLAHSEYLVILGWIGEYIVQCVHSSCVFNILLEQAKQNWSLNMEVYMDDTCVSVGNCGCLDLACWPCYSVNMRVSHSMCITCVLQGIYTCLIWSMLCVCEISSVYDEEWHSCFTVTALFLNTIYRFTPWLFSNQILPLPSITVVSPSHSISGLLSVCPSTLFCRFAVWMCL